MKQRNLLSETDNENCRKDYQSPLCQVMQTSCNDVVRTSEPSGTPIEWYTNWGTFLSTWDMF